MHKITTMLSIQFKLKVEKRRISDITPQMKTHIGLLESFINNLATIHATQWKNLQLITSPAQTHHYEEHLC